ncbi:glycerophosphodiester phosphodiesterase family protein [Microbispora sp. NBC_01189]|uniref:glycerophosphodiester phosphodiesterase family protein n=1 Tax=Microbispora sp. NBC_01189 TaxID=2903583 RepID=UPI002E136090|nr:glycerophosphodiester phosphodiesterase family protein [Microbispora sp. NBC_01189]
MPETEAMLTETIGYVRRVHRLGMKVLVWTVDAPAAVRRLIGAGVDGISASGDAPRVGCHGS